RCLDLGGFAVRERRYLNVSDPGFFDARLDRGLNNLRPRQSHLSRLTLMQYSNVHCGTGLSAKQLIDIVQTQIPRGNLAEVFNEVARANPRLLRWRTLEHRNRVRVATHFRKDQSRLAAI